ncbi:MAG: hypothetical protein AB7H96_24160 [Vicinamibacterales bacterium]
MHLVQILLPVFDNAGRRFPEDHFTAVRQALTGRFGGVTAYVRSPAAGLWRRDDGRIEPDEMIMLEVMVESLDPEWWREYRQQLEQRFAQDVIVVRAIEVRPL